MMTSQYYLHLSSTDDISRHPSNTGAMNWAPYTSSRLDGFTWTGVVLILL